MKKTYSVTIRATITKDIIVEAGDEDEAYELAHELFTTECDDDENYEEETIDIEVIE